MYRWYLKSINSPKPGLSCPKSNYDPSRDKLRLSVMKWRRQSKGFLDNHLKGTSRSQKKIAIWYRWFCQPTTPIQKEVPDATIRRIGSAFKKHLHRHYVQGLQSRLSQKGPQSAGSDFKDVGAVSQAAQGSGGGVHLQLVLWLVDGLMDAGYQSLHLANPSAIRQYEGLKHIDDRHDAFFLAQLLILGILPQGYIYPKKDRPLRDLTRKRLF